MTRWKDISSDFREAAVYLSIWKELKVIFKQLEWKTCKIAANLTRREYSRKFTPKVRQCNAQRDDDKPRGAISDSAGLI